jgi:hypothetical protein
MNAHSGTWGFVTIHQERSEQTIDPGNDCNSLVCTGVHADHRSAGCRNRAVRGTMLDSGSTLTFGQESA